MCQEAAEIVLRKEFKLPKLRLVKIKPARGNVTIAQYRQPLSFDLDNGTIEVNTHPDIRKLGGVKAIGQKTVTSGWAAQDNAILHELAHMIDYKCRDMFPLDAREQIGDRFDKLDTQKIKTILSQYGATKAAEFRAEIISGALAGNVYPEEFAKAAYLDRYTENSGMKKLYDMTTGKMPNTSATEQKFANTMEVLFRQEGAQFQIDILANDKVQDFISSHAQVLDNAFKFEPMSDAMRQRLQRSNYIFSGFKTFHELNEATHALIDENGNRKPFEQFLNDVRRIDRTYNRNYLRAEYNFVHASATMAAKWEEFQQDGDRYNLQYRTAHDDKVRPEHAALDRVTLPITDPFWEEYYPPNGWNCRCTVVQVRKSKYPETPHDQAMALGEEATGKDTKGIFHFNPGIEKKTIPDYNPYTIRRCRDCDIAKGKLELAFIPENELCQACRLLHSGLAKVGETRKEGNGTVTINQLVNREDSDFHKLDEIATFFAREQGAEVILTPKMSRPPKFQYECIYGSLVGTKYEGKCPDLCVNGGWYEHEGFTSSNPKNAFRNMLNDGLKQSNRLIIDKPNLTDAYMKRVIRQRIKDGQAIEEIWIKEDSEIRILYKKSEE